MRKMEKKTKKTWEALKMKLKTGAAQTHTVIRTDISFMNDTDEEIDTAVIEEEDWIEYMRRSTDWR